jgi:hypothetical protein
MQYLMKLCFIGFIAVVQPGFARQRRPLNPATTPIARAPRAVR